MHSLKQKTFRNIVVVLAAVFIFTVVVLFSWNSFAPELFQWPQMQFKQALGLVLFISCISFLLGLINDLTSY